MNRLSTLDPFDFYQMAGYSINLDRESASAQETPVHPYNPRDFSTSYSCIFNWERMKYEFVAPSIEQILGYSTHYFYEGGFDFTLSLVHPTDLKKLKQIHGAIFDYYYATPADLRLELRFSYNFRIRTAENNFIEVLRQSTFTNFTTDGKPTLEFVTCTDISGYASDENITLKVHRKSTEGLYVNCFEKTFWHEFPRLSAREQQVLQLVKTGLTTKEIAERLFLSRETIKSHRKNILIKTGAGNLTSAINILSKNKDHLLGV